MTVIAVIVVAHSILSVVTLQYLGSVWLSEVQKRVGLDLNSARAAYNNHIDRLASFLRAAALDPHLASAVSRNDVGELERLLGNAHRAGGMDIFCALDGSGKVVYRSSNPRQKGDDLAGNPLVRRVLQGWKPATGTLVLSAPELEREGAGLAERARVALVPTPPAHPTDDTVRTDGMVFAAAVPVFDEDGKPAAVLYGGDLLNHRYELVDAIKEEVFGQEVYEGKDIGTVTIFLGDLRISTNVTWEDGQRVVGTRLSADVADAVLGEGATWEAPAIVVQHWYITAYEPIRDPADRIIGVLYVGLLRAPFLHRLHVLIGVFLATVLGTTVASLGLIFLVTKFALRPIGQIIAMQRRIVAGDLAARIGIRPSGEMGRLCHAIDSMADALAEREQRLKQVTREQIGRSEQLASVGRLAAGVAHEINNPLTGVLTFAHLLREKANMDDQDREDLDLIIRETSRAAAIVRSLLDFAREGAVAKAPVDVNGLVRQTVRLLGNREAFQQIFVVEDLAEGLPEVEGDANQIQQVLLNLSLNACEAMPKGGTLMITTAAQDRKVLVKVVDTGCGIKREHLDRIFEPFFSTKPVGKGTGLGLAVSYGIVQHHGGTLEVQSEEGKGSTFTIVLPAVEGAP